MDIVKFYRTVRKLKEIERSGWVERGVERAESVSDHSFMLALLCMIISKQGIDKEKAIKMALVHDLAESEIGDIISKENWPKGGIMSNSEKIKMEEKAMQKIVSYLSKVESEEVFKLWKEFEQGKLPEAKFVKELDNVEMILQALDYHSKGNYKKPLEPFWDERNMNKIKDNNIKRLIEEIIDKGW